MLFRKTIAVLTAGVFLTQSLWSDGPEKRFWESRRSPRAQKIVPLKAPLPALSPSADAILPVAIKNSVPTSLLEAHRDLWSTVPPDWGIWRGVFRPSFSRAGAPRVVLVQDVHQMTEAQKKIGGAVGRWSRLPGTIVGLEGAVGPVNLSVFRQEKYNKVAPLVADYLLLENKISGPIRDAIVAPQAPSIHGVEDFRLYQDNVSAYQEAAPRQKKLTEQLAAWQRRLSWEKRWTYNKNLFALDRAVVQHRAGGGNLEKYIGALLEGDPTPPPLLAKFQKALVLERGMDVSSVEADRRRLLEELGPRLRPADLQALARLSLTTRLGQSALSAFDAQVMALCEQKGVPWRSHSVFRNYLQGVALADDLNPVELRVEIERQEKRAYERQILTSRERDLIQRDRRAHLLSRLVNFALLPEEWREYKNLRPPFSPPDLRPFEKFYEKAEARNNVLARQFWNIMEQTQCTTGVLVTGGYHTEAIARALTARGATVWVWSPRLEKTEGEAALTAFAREPTPFAQFVQGEQLLLAPPPVSAEAAMAFVANALGAEAGLRGQTLRDQLGPFRVEAAPREGDGAEVTVRDALGVTARWSLFLKEGALRVGGAVVQKSGPTFFLFGGLTALASFVVLGEWGQSVLSFLLISAIPFGGLLFTRNTSTTTPKQNRPPFHIAALVADVDMTAIESGVGLLEGKNKELILRALRAGVRVIFISGSIYHASENDAYQIQNSLKRRISQVLKRELEKTNDLSLIENLEIHYVSGKGSVQFKAQGKEVERRQLGHEMPVAQRLQLLKSLAGAYHSHIKKISIESYWTSREKDRLESARSIDELVSLLRQTSGKSNVEMYDYVSAVGLYEKEDPQEENHRPIGNILTRRLKEIETKRGRPINGKPTFHSFGQYFAQVSTLRKRDVIAKRLEKLWVKEGGVVVGIGDSTIDDFLHINEFRFPYWSFYLGAETDLPEDSLVRMVRGTQGQENMKTAGFETVLQFLLDAHERKKPMASVMATVNKKWPKHDALLRRMAHEEGIAVGPDTRYGIYVGGPHIRDGYYYRSFRQVARTFFGDTKKFAYLPVDIDPAHPEASTRLAYIRRLIREHPRVLWLVITRPWKETLFHHRARASTKTGAVNFVVRDGADVYGHATDGRAWLKGLSHDWGRSYDFSGKNVVVLGAGGAAKEIAEVLIGRGISHLTLVDPSHMQRKKMGALLAKLSPDYPYEILGGEAPAQQAIQNALASARVVVNATGLGRGETADQSPLLNGDSLKKVEVASELISFGDTLFMKMARAAGVPHVFNGRSMAIFGMVEYFREAVRQLAPHAQGRDYDAIAFGRFEKALALEDVRSEIMGVAKDRGITGGPWTKYLLRPVRSRDADDGADALLNHVLAGLGKDVRVVNLPITGRIWKMTWDDDQFQIVEGDTLGLKRLLSLSDENIDGIVEEVVPYIQKAGEGSVDRSSIKKWVKDYLGVDRTLPPTAAIVQSLAVFAAGRWPTNALSRWAGRHATVLGIVGLVLETPFLVMGAQSLPLPLLGAFLVVFGWAHVWLEKGSKGESPLGPPKNVLFWRGGLLGLYLLLPLGMDPLWVMSLHVMGDVGLVGWRERAAYRDGARDFDALTRQRTNGSLLEGMFPFLKKEAASGAAQPPVQGVADSLEQMMGRWFDPDYRAGALAAARRLLKENNGSGAAAREVLSLLEGRAETPLSLVDIVGEETSVEDMERWSKSYEPLLYSGRPSLRWALLASPELRKKIEERHLSATVFYTRDKIQGRIPGAQLREMADQIDPWAKGRPILLRVGKGASVTAAEAATLPRDSAFRRALDGWVVFSEEIEKFFRWVQAVAAYA